MRHALALHFNTPPEARARTLCRRPRAQRGGRAPGPKQAPRQRPKVAEAARRARPPTPPATPRRAAPTRATTLGAHDRSPTFSAAFSFLDFLGGMAAAGSGRAGGRRRRRTPFGRPGGRRGGARRRPRAVRSNDPPPPWVGGWVGAPPLSTAALARDWRAARVAPPATLKLAHTRSPMQKVRSDDHRYL